MSKLLKKLSPKFILPALLVLGVIFGLAGFIFNIPDYFELLSTKVTYPNSYEFKIFDKLLKKYVTNGLVDYQTLKRDPDLQVCYRQLEQTGPEQLKGKLELLSYWINTYNFLTVKCIADSYPITRLRQEAAVKKFIVGGKIYSLNQIKEEVLPELILSSDWRSVFLICNGSVSAPFLASHAYTASEIGDEFEPAMRRFVLSKVNYEIKEDPLTISISPFYRENLRYIDDVYRSPFDLVNEHLPPHMRVDLDKVFRNYAMPYDWRINDTAWLKDMQKHDNETDEQTIERLGKENRLDAPGSSPARAVLNPGELKKQVERKDEK